MLKRVGSEKGFTLLELLVAITIFAVGLLGVMTMQTTAISSNSSSNTMTVGTAMAGGILEEILARDVSDPSLVAGANWDFDPGGSGVMEQTIEGAGSYRAQHSVEVDYNGVSDLNRITVTVSGTSPGNLTRTVSLVGFKRMVE